MTGDELCLRPSESQWRAVDYGRIQKTSNSNQHEVCFSVLLLLRERTPKALLLNKKYLQALAVGMMVTDCRVTGHAATAKHESEGVLNCAHQEEKPVLLLKGVETSYSVVPAAPYAVVRHSPPSNTKVKIWWNHTSTS
jgi:hypothetical protein